MKPDSRDEPSLPWSLILILLAGVGISAWLVFAQGWSVEGAYGVVALGFAGLVLLLGLALLGMTPRAQWPELKAIILKTWREDWRAIRKVIGKPFMWR